MQNIQMKLLIHQLLIVNMKVFLLNANPSHIYAEDFHDTTKCMTRNQNKIIFNHGECGMTTEHIIHPLFVTDSDRSYCAQCVYMEANLVDDLERDPQFDEASNPHCSYSIRKGTVDGPEVHAAVVGETVFHVWQCSSENVGILVQNCHVEDLQGDKILIIDQNGCGVDQYLFKTPQYSSDLHTAFLQSSVFKFVDKSMTRFRCQLRLCVKNRGRGCSSTTPPTTCPSIEDPLEDSDSPLAPGTGPSSPAPQSSPASGSAAVLGLGSPPSLSPTVEQILQRPSAFPVPSERSERVGPPSIGRDALNIPQDITLVSGSGGGNNIVTHFYTKGEGGGGGGERYSSPSTTTTTTQKSPNTSWAAADQPVGPPSIRPYGPGRPISALSGTQIVSGKTEQPTNISPYRQKRSLSSFQIINGIGKYLNKRSKRKTNNREEGVQELLDVVGLIRVLDNSDDIQYFG
uniref:ZP domain-containing protein n=1 Tax=Meloidogyne incognita TaxID=6306 RepID=A0A914MQK7_MELIC